MYETMTYRHVIRKRNNLIYDKKMWTIRLWPIGFDLTPI